MMGLGLLVNSPGDAESDTKNLMKRYWSNVTSDWEDLNQRP